MVINTIVMSDFQLVHGSWMPDTQCPSWIPQVVRTGRRQGWRVSSFDAPKVAEVCWTWEASRKGELGDIYIYICIEYIYIYIIYVYIHVFFFIYVLYIYGWIVATSLRPNPGMIGINRRFLPPTWPVFRSMNCYFIYPDNMWWEVIGDRCLPAKPSANPGC